MTRKTISTAVNIFRDKKATECAISKSNFQTNFLTSMSLCREESLLLVARTLSVVKTRRHQTAVEFFF